MTQASQPDEAAVERGALGPGVRGIRDPGAGDAEVGCMETARRVFGKGTGHDEGLRGLPGGDPARLDWTTRRRL